MTMISLVLLLTAGSIAVSGIGCKTKPACGNKQDHKKRKTNMKRMAPAMTN